MPDSARIVLFCLIGLLLVSLGFLVAFALLMRRRPPPQASSRPVVIETKISDAPSAFAAVAPPMRAMSPSVGAVEGVAVETGASSSSLACPSCRREYEGDLVFCPNDARRLVPSTEMVDRARRGGAICPRCRRAFDPGVRFCPHDAADLVPMSIYEATKGGRRDPVPTGVLAKICPQCRKRYDLAATFCGKDGSELRTIN